MTSVENKNHISSISETTSEEKINALYLYLKSLHKANPTWKEDPKTYVPDIRVDNNNLVGGYSKKKEHLNVKELEDLVLPNMPIKVGQDEEMGRHLIAQRDIKAGEVVLIEPPYVLGPMGCNPQCLYCLSPTKGDFSCPECGFYFCNESCLNDEHDLECADLKKLNLSETKFTEKKESFASKLRKKQESDKDSNNDQNKSSETTQKFKAFLMKASVALQSRKSHVIQKNLLVTTLRTLREMEAEPNNYHTIIAMQANVVPESPQYQSHAKSMVIPIKAKIRPNVDPDLLQRIAAVWDTNCFEVAMGSSNRAQGMYPVASLINHACKANLQQSYAPHGIMIMRAIEDIPKGSPFSIWYMNPLWPTRMRRQHLDETKHFECICERCRDPTEFGSYMGSPLCLTCKETMLPDDPLDFQSNWHCTGKSCDFIMEHFKITAMDSKMAPILLKVTGKDLDVLKNIVDELLEKLHPQNHLLIRIHLAAILYHSICDISDYSEDHLKTLSYSSKVLLDVLKLIEAPLATKRGRISREYLRCRLETLRRLQHQKDIKPEVLELKEEMDLCTLCLGWSPNSPSMDEIHQLYKELSCQ